MRDNINKSILKFYFIEIVKRASRYLFLLINPLVTPITSNLYEFNFSLLYKCV